MRTVGLAYFSILIVILGSAGIAVVLLKAAWEIWKKARFKFLAIIPNNNNNKQNKTKNQTN